MASLIEINNLSLSLGSNTVFENVNFILSEREVIFLSGDNGSGKSTLLKAIFGDTSGMTIKGEILFRSKNILDSTFKLQDFRKHIGYVPQEDSFCEDTPFKEVLYSYRLHSGKDDKDYINDLFDKFGISYLKNKRLFSRRGPELSGGEKKMVSLLAVLCRKESELFLIDEPLNNLDSKHVKTISNMITSIHETNPKAGIIIVTHCHALSCIGKQYRIDKKHIYLMAEKYECFNCFGCADDKGYYKL